MYLQIGKLELYLFQSLGGGDYNHYNMNINAYYDLVIYKHQRKRKLN